MQPFLSWHENDLLNHLFYLLGIWSRIIYLKAYPFKKSADACMDLLGESQSVEMNIFRHLSKTKMKLLMTSWDCIFSAMQTAGFDKFLRDI